MKLFVDNLINLDFSYLHPTRGLVGETWLASVELDGELDEQGMICDFGIVKKTLREWLDSEIDHRLLVPTLSTSLVTHKKTTDSIELNWNDSLRCASPHQAITLVDSESITTESVANWALEKLEKRFPNTVAQLSLSFTPEKIGSPFYHYSHGLKKHAGNCQRIAHGHRSKIEIWRNGELSEADMQAWAQNWADIYIATESDLLKSENGQHFFAYTAAQGAFELSLPESKVYFLETDSTVEFIAQHIATKLKTLSPNDSFTVKAYEGLAKGAIAQA